MRRSRSSVAGGYIEAVTASPNSAAKLPLSLIHISEPTRLLSIAPITLGAGERLFDGVELGGEAGIRLKPVQVFENAAATHLVYDIVR